VSRAPSGVRRRLAWLAMGVALIWLVAAGGGAAAATSAYFRVLVSRDFTVYALVRERELRFSATAEGLSAVSPVRAEKLEISSSEGGGVWYNYTFPEITLSVPSEELPSGFTQLRVALQYNASRTSSGGGRREEPGYVYGRLALCREDEQGREWSYWWSRGSETGTKPERAPGIEVPRIGSVSLKITTQAKSGREVGIAVQVMAGETALDDIKRDGKSVSAELEVLDRQKEVVESERKPLSDLGFT